MNEATKAHDYKLKYDLTFKAGHFKAEDLRAKGKGGTDALILISCIEHEDGSYSQGWQSYDGNRGATPMSTAQEFKAWNMMGASLLERTDLKSYQRHSLEVAIEVVRKYLLLP